VGRLLIISGVPASGKSTYCAWLADRGWVFIDHDRITPRPTDQLWWRLLTSGHASDFLTAISAGSEDVVLEFGFPLGLLSTVRELKAAGGQHWWFDADHPAARAAFTARNDEWSQSGNRTIDLAAFETQIQQIALHEDEIRAVFEPRIIETLDRTGQRLSVDEIDSRVTAGSFWPERRPSSP
jgi:hypothetical protein